MQLYGAATASQDAYITPAKAESTSERRMAFKPNYGRDRAERARTARTRSEEKQLKKDEKTALRKARRAEMDPAPDEPIHHRMKHELTRTLPATTAKTLKSFALSIPPQRRPTRPPRRRPIHAAPSACVTNRAGAR